MIIILEGPDRTGKTTLSNKFQELSKFKYFHGTNKKPWFFQKKIIHYIKHHPNENIIIDRSIISHLVYSQIFKCDECEKLWCKIYKDWKKILLNSKTINIFCLPQDDSLWYRNFMKHKNERCEIYEDNMREVYNEFYNYYEKLAHLNNCKKYDFYKDDIDLFCEEVIKCFG